MLKTGHQGSMSKEKFFKSLGSVDQSPFSDKVKKIEKYFHTQVFGSSEWYGMNPNNWGSLLVSLRDKVAHRDRLRPSFDSGETLVGGVLFDWPTLRNITYDRFCQYMQNGMFALFTDVSPIIYELEWKAGVYKPDLWE